MSLAIAIQTNEGIVVASDSRGTFGDPRGVTGANDTIQKVYGLTKYTVRKIQQFFNYNASRGMIGLSGEFAICDLAHIHNRIQINRHDEIKISKDLDRFMGLAEGVRNDLKNISKAKRRRVLRCPQYGKLTRSRCYYVDELDLPKR